MEKLQTEVLVVGGGTGAVAAAVQAARCGAETVLVSEFPWLGGMLTAAGVAAPDGNELLALQTGLWGAFLRELRRRQPGGLDHAWVSFFTYQPKVGAAIFADWVRALPNLHWRVGQRPRSVMRSRDRVLGVCFDQLMVYAHITLDGTELGEVLALGEIPHRWGWEDQDVWQEPSAPQGANDAAWGEIVRRFPVQAPTWVVVMRDGGEAETAPAISPPPDYDPARYTGAWEAHGPDAFWHYGQLPGGCAMINWPHQGNDYGVDLWRLVASDRDRAAWERAAIAHSQGFAHFIQAQLGRRYGLATETFPQLPGRLGGGAYALHPYYRESRRLVGLSTVREQDILPATGTQAAPLPINGEGVMSAIAVGNYPNDHHYPGYAAPLAPKTMRWGGRWTGTPFAVPYEALVPAAVDGLLVCDKNLSVSHIANGATRLQPVVLGLGQAAGQAAALCVERRCEPRSLSVRDLQDALLGDPLAPAAIVPLLDCPPTHPHWRQRQQRYRDRPDCYPPSLSEPSPPEASTAAPSGAVWMTGICQCTQSRGWRLLPQSVAASAGMSLVTLCPWVNQQLQQLSDGQPVTLLGFPNRAGGWLQVIHLQETSSR